MSIRFSNTNRYENSEDSIPIRMKNENEHIKLFDTSKLSLGLSDSDLESLIIKFKDHILINELNTQLLIICTSLQYLNLQQKISDDIVKTIYNIYNTKPKNKNKNNLILKEDIYIYLKFLKLNSIQPTNNDGRAEAEAEADSEGDGAGYGYGYGYDDGGYGDDDGYGVGDYGGYGSGGGGEYGYDDYEL